MKKGTIPYLPYNEAGEMALQILDQIVKELGLSNVKCFGYHKEMWVVKYKKGKQDKFNSFDEMYSFLKTESI